MVKYLCVPACDFADEVARTSSLFLTKPGLGVVYTVDDTDVSEVLQHPSIAIGDESKHFDVIPELGQPELWDWRNPL